MPIPSNSEPTLDALLPAAIEHRQLIRFRYHDQERIVEPHDHGVQNGVTKQLGYQGWRLRPRPVTKLVMVGAGIDLQSSSLGKDFSWRAFRAFRQAPTNGTNSSFG